MVVRSLKRTLTERDINRRNTARDKKNYRKRRHNGIYERMEEKGRNINSNADDNKED